MNRSGKEKRNRGKRKRGERKERRGGPAKRGLLSSIIRGGEKEEDPISTGRREPIN